MTTAVATATPGQSHVIRPGDNVLAVINAAAPGDVFLLSSGAYHGGAIRCNGVTIRPNGEGKVAFRGALALHANGVVLEGLTWEDLNGTMLEISGRSNVVRRCEFRHFGQQRPAKAIWIRETGNYSGNRIEECLFEDWGGLTYHSSCVKIDLLYDCPMYAWQIWTGHGSVWRNNVVVDCGQIAIIKGGDKPEQIAADDLLINNTFVNNRRGIIWDLKRFPPQGIRFINNMFVGARSAAIETRGEGLYQEDYNLYAGYRPPAHPGAHSIVGKEPLFADVAHKDFHLRPGSAGIDAGLASGPDVPRLDKDGTSRPRGLGVDIGAYEWQD